MAESPRRAPTRGPREPPSLQCPSETGAQPRRTGWSSWPCRGRAPSPSLEACGEDGAEAAATRRARPGRELALHAQTGDRAAKYHEDTLAGAVAGARSTRSPRCRIGACSTPYPSTNMTDFPASLRTTCDTLFLHDANATLYQRDRCATRPKATRPSSRAGAQASPASFLRNSGMRTRSTSTRTSVCAKIRSSCWSCATARSACSALGARSRRRYRLRAIQYASRNQTATLAQMYRSHLREQVVRQGDCAPVRLPSLASKTSGWRRSDGRAQCSATKSHQPRAARMRANDQDLRADRETTAPYHDPHFQRFFVNHGPSWHHKRKAEGDAAHSAPLAARRDASRCRAAVPFDLAALEEVHLDLDHTMWWGPFCLLFG